LWSTCKRCPLIAGCVVPPECGSTLEKTVASDELIGHWQDLGEPEQFDPSGVYYGTQEDDGFRFTDHRAVHNLYQFFKTKDSYEMYRKQNLAHRAQHLVRTGAPGIQRYGGALWSGDIGGNVQSMAMHIGSKKHLAMAGIDVHSSDIGGFHRQGGNDIGNLYTTWLANSAWFDLPIRPHVNAHNDRSLTACAARIGDVPSNRFNVQLRYHLIPLYYSLAYHGYINGDPIITPLFLRYQNDPSVYNFGHQYLIGPIMASYTADDTNAVGGRGLYLPANTQWYNFHTHAAYRGSNNYTVDIPFKPFGNTIVTMPAAVQSGSLFPTAFVDNNTKNVRCYDRFDGSTVCPNQWKIYPGASSDFTMYEDDGESQAYLNGAYISAVGSQVLNGSVATFKVAAAKGTYNNIITDRKLVAEFIIPAQFSGVASVTVDGVSVGVAPAGTTAATSGTGYLVTGFGSRIVAVHGAPKSIFTERTVVVTFR
jgi:alpha-glucosidase